VLSESSEYLDMQKLCAKWVPRVLTIDQKQQCDSEQCFAIFNCNKYKFFRRYIAMDVTWLLPTLQNPIDSLPSELNAMNRRQSVERHNGQLDSHGIIFIDHLEKGQTINSNYNTALLERFHDEIKKKNPHNNIKKCCLIKTIQRFTNQSKRRLNCMNYTMNCFFIHRFLQI
jgi:hypothetical protein